MIDAERNPRGNSPTASAAAGMAHHVYLEAVVFRF